METCAQPSNKPKKEGNNRRRRSSHKKKSKENDRGENESLLEHAHPSPIILLEVQRKGQINQRMMP